jgi:acetolactate synthase-1/2/3 large subunit
MNGAEALLRTAAGAGVGVCFANPGTTEMEFVAALDRVPAVRSVLALFEGVCTGAADGYARMTRKPALTLLHLGPGFANGIANLHNARRARVPIVNLIGDHASWHLPFDAPLTSDIESLARPVSGWLRSAASAKELARDAADAIHAALTPPGQVATLVIPQSCAWDESDGPQRVAPAPDAPAVPDANVAAAAAALRDGAAVLFLGGEALGERGLRAASRVASASGCRVLFDTFFTRLERGGALPAFERLPYFPEQAREALAGSRTLVVAGTREPVGFFGYRDGRSRLAPEDARIVPLASPGEDVAGALEALAERLGPPRAQPAAAAARPAPPTGKLDPLRLGQAIAALQPDGAIVVDEAATSGLAYLNFSASAPRHTLLSLTGGAIGQGLPCATGAAVACPDRKVIAFQADGSGMYTLQALWTCARESLDVVAVVCANRAYRILQAELGRSGVAEPGPAARALTSLAQPELDWVALARGLGVPGTRVDNAESFCDAFARAVATPGPALIEALL